MRFYVVGTVEGGVSSEPERKEPGYHLPLQPLPEEQEDSGCRCQGYSGPGSRVWSTDTICVFTALCWVP